MLFSFVIFFSPLPFCVKKQKKQKVFLLEDIRRPFKSVINKRHNIIKKNIKDRDLYVSVFI